MKEQRPLALAELAGAGMSVIGAVVVGLLLGLAAARWLQWSWAVPAGVVAGFAGGLVAMFRRLSTLM